MSAALSRRTVLAGSAVGTAAALASAPARAAGTTDVDCVVVGAGLSGLAAARRLVEAGRSVVVLEARERPGGRVEDVLTVGGTTFDGGAKFIGPTQNAIAALAAEYGASTVPTYNTGTNIYWRNGRATPYPAALGIPVDWSIGETALAIGRLTAITVQIDPARPWAHPLAPVWDAITFQDWIRTASISASARLQLGLICSATLSVSAREVSALFMFSYIAAAGDRQNPGTMFRLLNTDGGAQERYFPGGAAQIPRAMAAQLGSRVVYGAAVSSIDTRAGNAVVTTSAGTYTGRRVVVAMSPQVAARISYPAGLTTARSRIHAQMRMGSEGKFVAFYERPFWRDRGQTGQVIGDGSPLDVTFSYEHDGRHALMGFLSGDNMRRLDAAPDAQLVQECTDILVSYFGPEARTGQLDHGFKRWNTDPWSLGGPTGIAGPGLLTRAGAALRAPIGPLHWAGTESAVYWQGYMDGAVTAGRRAADEVHAAL